MSRSEKCDPAIAIAEMQVVLVEDDETDQEFFLRQLCSAGFLPENIHTVETGEEALQRCKRSPPDCLLLDYRLPDVDGLELLMKLARYPRQLPLPVVVLTGKGNEQIAVEAMKLGAHDYIVKERITPELLRDSLISAVKRRELEAGIRKRLDNLSTFVHAVVHDIRTPLTSLGLNLDILDQHQRMNNSDAVTESVEAVGRSYEQLKNLLESLHRLVAEAEPFDQNYFELRESVDLALESLGPQLANSRIRFSIGSLPAVVSDAPVVAEVLLNILSNAVEHADGVEPLISIRGIVDRRNASDVQAGLSVEDNGKGLGEEELGRMFEPMWRGRASGEPAQGQKHMGLGLSICRRLLDRLGGRIWADNGTGGGARVFITLPTIDDSHWTRFPDVQVIHND